MLGSACSVARCRPSMRWLFRSGLPIEAFLHGAHSTHNFPQGRTANFIKFIVTSSLALFPPFLFPALDLFMIDFIKLLRLDLSILASIKAIGLISQIFRMLYETLREFSA